jgi:hypothetical protein
MDSMAPQEAQRIVAAYLRVVDAHAAADVYPCSVDELPQPKETIRAAFRISVTTIASLGQLTPEMRDYLEVAYVSLADYVDGELRELLREYVRAGEELAADRRLVRDKATTDAWRRVTEQSGLIGQLARRISEDAERLCAEFRSWQSGAASAAS